MIPKVSEVLDYTTTVLGDGATYTGKHFETSLYSRIVGSVLANRAGTLYVDQSSDGTNYDCVTTIPYTAADTMGFDVAVVAPNARVRFTNAAGAASTTFRLYVRGRRN